MFIPSLPTDNIYKMFFIAGLAIVLSATIICLNQKQKLETNVAKFREEVLAKENEIDYETGKLNFTSKELQNELNDELKSISKVDSTYTSKRIEKHLNDVKKMNIENEGIKLKIEGNKKVIELKKDLLLKDKWLLNFLGLLYILFLALGLALTGYGYEKWKTLIQIPNDERIQLELAQLKRNIQKESENN